MPKRKLNITVDEDLYHRLYTQVGKGDISVYICKVIRPHLMESESELEAEYREMALDKEREDEAFAWSESFLTDITDEELGTW